jgi:hypothetical protein
LALVRAENRHLAETGKKFEFQQAVYDLQDTETTLEDNMMVQNELRHQIGV